MCACIVNNWSIDCNYFTEFFVLLSLFLAVLYDIVLYLNTTLRNPGIKVTAQQKKILGVSDKGMYNFTFVSNNDQRLSLVLC